MAINDKNLVSEFRKRSEELKRQKKENTSKEVLQFSSEKINELTNDTHKTFVSIDIMENDIDDLFLNLFTKVIFEKIEGRSNILYDVRKNKLSRVSTSGKVETCDGISFRNFINGRLNDCMPNYVDREGRFFRLETNNGSFTKVRWKQFKKCDAKDFYSRLVTIHCDEESEHSFGVTDRLLELWRSYEWDGKDRFSISPWIYENDKLEIGKHLLIKFVTEPILWAMGIMDARLTENLHIIGPRRIGKTALCKKIFGKKNHVDITNAFTLQSRYDYGALVAGKLVLEFPECSAFNNGNENESRGITTNDKTETRLVGSNNVLYAPRTQINVMTSNYDRSIHPSQAGKSTLPIKIVGINPEYHGAKLGMDLVDIFKREAEQMIAQVIYKLEVEKVSLDDLYPSFVKKYGDKLDEHQKPYLKDFNNNQSSINLLEDRLNGLDFDVYKYPVQIGCFKYWLGRNNERGLSNLLKESDWTSDRFNFTNDDGKRVQGTYWYHKNNYVLGHLTKKEQYEYLITEKHLDSKLVPKPLPNEDGEDNSSPDGPSKPPNKPQPQSPNDSPQTTLGPNTEESRTDREDNKDEPLKPLEKGDQNLPTLPESNLTPEAFSDIFVSIDDRYIGNFRSIFDVEVKDLETNKKDWKTKFCITPRFVDPELYEEIYPSLIDSDRDHYGALNSDVIVGGQLLFGEWDFIEEEGKKILMTLPQQYELILRINEKIPVSRFLYTGNKSLQFYIFLEEPIYDLDELKILQEGLSIWADSDKSIKNTNRLMAHPLGPNPHTGKMPICWKVNDRRATKDELSFLKKFVKPKKKNIIKYNPVRMNLGFKSSDEVKLDIKLGWDKNRLEPSTESSANKYTYDQYRDLVFATSVLCQENNINLEWLIQLLQNHSPNRKKAFERAVLTAKGDIRSGTFYRWFNEGKMPGEE